MPLKANYKVRLHFEVTPALKDSLVTLQERAQCISITEVFRQSLALQEIVTSHNESGGSLILRHKDEREETIKIL